VFRLRWLAHSGPVNDLTISADGRFVASASADRTAALLPTRLSVKGPWRPYRVDNMSPDEGLALYSEKEADANTELFDRAPESGKTGLAWRLRDKEAAYVSAAWDYRLLDRARLKTENVRVRNLRTGAELTAWPVDFGVDSGKAAHLSAFLVQKLGLEAQDHVELELPSGSYPVGASGSRGTGW
jgi:hypothetical protein